MVQVSLIVDRASGVNHHLDQDGSRTPVEFPCGLGLPTPIQAQVVQAATKWKRMALAQFDCQPGQGICTDMRADLGPWLGGVHSAEYGTPSASSRWA